MKQIRENMYRVSYSELGQPTVKGYWKVPGTEQELLLDEADMRYIREYIEKGYEPYFFIKPSTALRNAFVVVSRQRV
ncbi:MAG TPA: hypothetical protein VG944_08100 [Fimbriimonas sp.]|nr:hypothetical protein [Fimbriimonas sp.]